MAATAAMRVIEGDPPNSVRMPYGHIYRCLEFMRASPGKWCQLWSGSKDGRERPNVSKWNREHGGDGYGFVVRDVDGAWVIYGTYAPPVKSRGPS